MRYLIFFSSVVFALCASHVYAQKPLINETKSKTTNSLEQGSNNTTQGSAIATQDFANALQALNTLSGHFAQRIVDAQGEELQVSEGEFSVKRPGYFLWQVAPPYEQLVLGTPETLKVYDPDLEQLNIYPGDSLLGTPAALISGDAMRIAEQYEVAYQGGDSKNIFLLTQKPGEESAFASLTFTFIQEGGERLIEQMVFVDNLGQKTEVVLSSVKMNQALADTLFNFEPPKGTDIIIDG